MRLMLILLLLVSCHLSIGANNSSKKADSKVAKTRSTGKIVPFPKVCIKDWLFYIVFNRIMCKVDNCRNKQTQRQLWPQASQKHRLLHKNLDVKMRKSSKHWQLKNTINWCVNMPRSRNNIKCWQFFGHLDVKLLDIGVKCCVSLSIY